MDVSDRTAYIINTLKPHISNLSNVSQTTQDGLLELYSSISRAYKSLDKLYQTNKIKASIMSINRRLRSSIPSNSKWVADDISKHILSNVTSFLSYSTKIGDRQVVVKFGMTEDQLSDLDKYDEHINFILMWLIVCAEYSSASCNDTITIQLFLTPYPKLLPTSETDNILCPDNVNSGYSYRCAPKGEIVIFREEEWRKVFIHETFHAFGLDPFFQPSESVGRMAKLFQVDSEFNIGEAYVETWARLCNCAVIAYTNGSSKSKYLKNVLFYIGIERMFACIQCNKVLSHMGLMYESLIGKTVTDKILRDTLYREKTHVLSYYIITAILLSNYSAFIDWCKQHNTSLLRFRSSSSRNLSLFVTLIKDEASSCEFINLINSTKSINTKHLQSSLVMSAIEEP